MQKHSIPLSVSKIDDIREIETIIDEIELYTLQPQISDACILYKLV